MTSCFLVREDKKRYSFYRVQPYRECWGTCSYHGCISKAGEIKKGLANGSLFVSKEEAFLKYEQLRSQSCQDRGFKDENKPDREIERFFPISRDAEILMTKKLSRLSKQSGVKMSNTTQSKSTDKYQIVERKELAMPKNFKECYTIDNRLESKKLSNTYFDEAWKQLGPDLQLCWIETH